MRCDPRVLTSVCACVRARVRGPQWSQEVCVRTADAECGDEELQAALRTVLNTKEYADKVAAQLYHEQWTLASLQSISPSRLEDVLRHMRVCFPPLSLSFSA